MGKFVSEKGGERKAKIKKNKLQASEGEAGHALEAIDCETRVQVCSVSEEMKFIVVVTVERRCPLITSTFFLQLSMRGQKFVIGRQ